jgi:hypothetical protein
MGIDHTTTGSDKNVETVEQKPTADHRPPPPPDRPGTPGYPSRADSRAGAAAANNTDQPAATDKREQKGGSTDVTPESPNGQNPAATEKDTAAGTQLNESPESPTKDTKTTAARTDSGTSPERTGERPAQQPDEATENTTDTGRMETAPNSHAASSETTLPADRSPSATEVLQQDEKKDPTDGLMVEADSRDKPDAGITGTAESSRPSAPDTAESQEMSSPGLDARETSRDATSGAHPDSTAGETHEPGRPADTTACTVAQPESTAGERHITTDHAGPNEPSADAGVSPETGDSQSPSPDTDRTNRTLPGNDAGSATQSNADVITTDQSHELVEPAVSTADSEQTSSETERSPELRTAPNAEETGVLGEDPGQATSPWKYDIRVQDMPLEAYLNTVGENELTDKLDTLADESTGIGPVWVEKRSDLPSGEDLLQERDEDGSRPEKLRRKFFEVVDDVQDITAKAADRGHDIFAHPPTGHAETSTSPEVVRAPNEGVNSGDVATAALALFVTFEGFRHRRNMKRKERN